MGSVTFSLEYFPARGPSAESALMNGAHALASFGPAFQTVTFGAGGTETGGTLDWAARLAELTGVPTAAHLTLGRFDRDALLDVAETIAEAGIKRIVLLRGDVPEGENDAGLAGFESVADALRTLKRKHRFDISVSAYPEVHPLAANESADLDALLAKQDAGADRAITQYFFDNEDFLRFRDRARKAGLRIPLVAGLIPIANFERICGFSEKCGARVPASFHRRFEEAGEDRANHTLVARSIIQRQVHGLLTEGVRDFHIYTLNRVDLAADAIRALRAGSPSADARPRLRAVA